LVRLTPIVSVYLLVYHVHGQSENSAGTGIGFRILLVR
jgi:hypothetical protein